MSNFVFDSIRDPDLVEASYLKYGLVLLKSVIDPETVQNLRTRLDALFSGPPHEGQRFMSLDAVLQHEFIYENIFDQKIVDCLKAVMGSGQLSYVNNIRVHHNNIAANWPKGKRYPIRDSTWHTDSGSEIGNAYLHDASYRFAKCAIHLQGASNGWGGGITAKPRSHNPWLPASTIRKKFLEKAWSLDMLLQRKLHYSPTTVTPDIEAGDFICFDSRLFHISNIPNRNNLDSLPWQESYYWDEIPAEHTKYVLYWDAGRPEAATAFLDNSVKRGLEEGSKFTRYTDLVYPDNFPQRYVDLVNQGDIRVAALAGDPVIREQKVDQD